MSDDLERLLRDVPARVPRPDERVTKRVRQRVLGIARPRASRTLSLTVLAATLAGIAIGYWMIPREEIAIGAAEPPPVTIEVKPTIARMWELLEIRGSVVTRRAGEQVLIEENLCNRGWTQVIGTATGAGGDYSLSVSGTQSAGANTIYRARWRGTVSVGVPVKVRPWLTLRQKGRRVFHLSVSTDRLAGRRAHLERYERSSNRWRVAARARLRSDNGFAEAAFRVTLRKSTIVRATVPLAQARPCFLGGYSNMMTVA